MTTEAKLDPDANVDPAEIAKFSALAHRWWDPTSEFRPLHEINPLRLAHVERLAGGLAGKRVVDVGCGGGILAEAMAAKGALVTGIDLAARPLKVAMLHRTETGSAVDYRLVSAESLAGEAPGAFDLVTCMEMLEHVPDPAAIVRACARLAKPGGMVFFSTLNRNAKSFLLAIVGAEYVLNLLPKGTHEYARFIRPAELARACREAGLAVTDLTGMTYNPFTKTYSLGRDVDVNYLLGRAVIEAVLFDLDGTLADTAPDMARTVNLMRTRRGLAPVAAEAVRPHVSKGARGMIASAFAIGADHPEFAAMREEFLALYADHLFVETCLFPGMESLLAHLEREAIAWGVVTNKFERFARPVLAGLGLERRAAVVVGGDTCARAKPFPDPLLHAAAAIGVAPRNALYVGDDERDVQAARAAGMPVVVAGYGYLGDGPAPALWGADAIVDSAAELERWIRESCLEGAAP